MIKATDGFSPEVLQVGDFGHEAVEEEDEEGTEMTSSEEELGEVLLDELTKLFKD